jgi:hypothetical protein
MEFVSISVWSRRILLSAGLVLVCAGAAAAKPAPNGDAQTVARDTPFTAGALTLSSSTDGEAILSAPGMWPGSSATGTVDIANSGPEPADFWLRRVALTDSGDPAAFSQQLNLLIEDCGTFVSATPPTCERSDSDVYVGTLAAMVSGQPLGLLAAGEMHRYGFTVTLDRSAGDQYQGDYAAATFHWSAFQ